MKYTVALYLIAILLYGCTQKDKKVNDEYNIKEPQPEKPTTGANALQQGITACYQYTAGRDTYAIQLTKHENNITGHMKFDNYEKDGSHGNIYGTLQGKNLKLIYSFESEGMKSKREIYLQEDGDNLVTGIGDEAVKGDSAYIKNPAAIKYTGIIYKKINCAETDH